ncbi:MAG TPA: DUF1302 family protein [Nevskiales bacterium]|nr:DUF1302 family protein [Nevskiales bacterium]
MMWFDLRMQSAAGLRRVLAMLTVLALGLPAQAAQFEFQLGEETVNAAINTSVQFGAQWRVEDRADDLIAKSALNPELCPRASNRAGTSCQGHLDVANPLHGAPIELNSFIGEGPGVNQIFVDAPGAGSSNYDDGNMNFDKGEITQAVGRFTTDVNLTWKNFGFFARGLGFYDTENRGKKQLYFNAGTIDGPNGLNNNGAKGRRGDRGDRVEFTRVNNDDVDDQIGAGFQLLDFNVSGTFPFFGDRELAVKLGRQSINWGESTLLIVNSLNTFSPPNVNNLFRPAFLDLAEVLQPIGAISASTQLTESLSVEAFYQYDWEQIEIPAPGSYLSFVDIGTKIDTQFVNLGFGKVPEDPLQIGIADQIMLSAITDTGERFPLFEREARDGGQYGLAFRYFADWLNDGTELGFYAANYHSRLPYLSTIAGQYGCLNGPGAPAPAPLTLDGINAVDLGLDPTLGGALPILPGTIELSVKDLQDIANVLGACPGADALLFVESALPVGIAPPAREQNIGANGDAFDADSIAALLEYPEDIKLYGISFNTSFGELSVQGEIAYRPKAPLQIDDVDLVFAALQNPLPIGNRAGDNTDRYDFGLPGVGTVAQLPGARYTVPDFVSAYRGRDPSTYAPGERIRGWEYFKTLQYNIGGTYIIGPNNWLKANQILLFGEFGVTQVLDMPDTDELQIEAPGTNYHASAGADGTGADGSKQSNSGVIGPSGIRFNPTQQDPDDFADDLSAGYRVIAILRYDNLFPGISLEWTNILAHDIYGTAPGPGENFLEGRKNLITNAEVRFAPGWSAAIGYVGFYGAGEQNLLRDRDFVNLGVRYRF